MKASLRHLNNFVDDELVMYRLKEELLYGNTIEAFNHDLFEQSSQLKQVDDEVISRTVMISQLADIREVGIFPSGATLWEQVYSLLPKAPILEDVQDTKENREVFRIQGSNPTFVTSADEGFKESMATELNTRFSIAYVMMRYISTSPKGLPLDLEWLQKAEGLDRFTRELFYISILARLSKSDLLWLRTLHRPDEESLPLTKGVSFFEDARRELIEKLRASVNIHGYDPARKAALAVIDKRQPFEFKKDWVRKTCGSSYRQSMTDTKNIQILMTECFIPSITALGLRYRLVISNRFKALPKNRALVMKAKTLESSFRGVSLYAEPLESNLFENPSMYIATADEELLSYRYDLFDEVNMKWEIRPWKDPEKYEENPQWLFIESPPKREGLSLFPAQVKTAVDLWAHKSNIGDRWLLQKLAGFRLDRVNELLDDNVFSYVQVLDPEHSHIPDVILVVIRNIKRKRLNHMLEWFASSFPLAHILFSREEGNVIAFLRTPMFSSVLPANLIREELRAEDIDAEVAVLGTTRTYYLSLAWRMFDEEEGSWRDPWSPVSTF